jgi:hypothetical protein
MPGKRLGHWVVCTNTRIDAFPSMPSSGNVVAGQPLSDDEVINNLRTHLGELTPTAPGANPCQVHAILVLGRQARRRRRVREAVVILALLTVSQRP